MRALENLASVDAYLAVGVRYVGAVTHETAAVDILPGDVHRGNRMASGRRINVLQAGQKHRIGINQQCLNASLNKTLESYGNVAIAARIPDN